MNTSTLVSDNISELLVKILEFTAVRHKVLANNISNMCMPGFVPRDLEAATFAGLINEAIEEHQRAGRLLMRDTENIKFGVNGSFQIQPIVDENAKYLLEENIDEYLELQKNKVAENLLNYTIAAELFRQKQGIGSVLCRLER